MVVVSFSRLVARLAYPSPVTADRLVVRTSAQFHLVHGVLLAEKASTFPAINASVYRPEPLSTCRIRAHVISCRALPMMSRYEFLRVDGSFNRELASGCCCGLRRRNKVGFIRFKNIEAAQLHVDHGQRLEALRFEDLFVEPCLDLVLFFGGEFLVGIIDVAVELEQSELQYGKNTSRQRRALEYHGFIPSLRCRWGTKGSTDPPCCP